MLPKNSKSTLRIVDACVSTVPPFLTVPLRLEPVTYFRFRRSACGFAERVGATFARRIAGQL
jgi:hypothetical protein